MEDASEYVTLKEGAEQIGRSKATLWRLVKRYKIQTYRRPMDRRAYVRPADLERIRETFTPREAAS